MSGFVRRGDRPADSCCDIVDDHPEVRHDLTALVWFFDRPMLRSAWSSRASSAGHRLRWPWFDLSGTRHGLCVVPSGWWPPVRTLTDHHPQNANGDAWVGPENYTWAFTDPDFQKVSIITALWIMLAPMASTALGLTLALLIDRTRREKVPKSLIFMPMAISFVGASIIWKFVYDYRSAGTEPDRPAQSGLHLARLG